jgi:hypothetical protein
MTDIPMTLPDVTEAVQQLKVLMAPHRGRYEQLLTAGRSSHWSCDQRTLDVWCLQHFLDEQFQALGLPDERRRQLGHAFHRMVRSAEDCWRVAAEVQLVGHWGLDIETYSQQYWTARNHGKWA